MEYIMINEEKLKVTLAQYDLEEWNITIDALDYSNPDAKWVFEDILDYAKEEFGFDTAGHKVLLQLYPSKDGGGELFITRLSALSEVSAADTKKARHSSNMAYRFDNLSYLLHVCKILKANNFCAESSAWTDDDRQWYLLISCDCFEDISLPIPSRISFISEYGEAKDPYALSLYLQEHATPVCRECAIEKLGEILNI